MQQIFASQRWYLYIENDYEVNSCDGMSIIGAWRPYWASTGNECLAALTNKNIGLHMEEEL